MIRMLGAQLLHMSRAHIIIVVLIIGCTSQEHKSLVEQTLIEKPFQKLDVGNTVINYNDSHRTVKNGVVNYQNKPYTGWVHRYTIDRLFKMI